MSVSLRPLCVLFLLLCTVPARAGLPPLRVHFPDGGLPPFLFLAPGGSRPVGIVADLVEETARQAGRTTRYEFRPRDQANAALAAGQVDLSLFFTVTRSAATGVRLTAPLLSGDALVVSRRQKPLAFRVTADLRNVPLCLLLDDMHPPLALLAMNGQLIQRRTKTEQAQLMMLTNDDCQAAVMSAPTYAWARAHYGGQDLVAAATPLLTESAVLGVRDAETGFADRLDAQLARWRSSGEYGRVVARYLPDAAARSAR